MEKAIDAVGRVTALGAAAAVVASVGYALSANDDRHDHLTSASYVR